MQRIKRRNTKRILEEQKPEKIKGFPKTIKIELFRGAIFFGIVHDISDSNILLQICKVENGMKDGEWKENDFVNINPNQVKHVIDKLYI